MGFPSDEMVKNRPTNVGDTGDTSLISGSGRSPGVGHGNPLQCSCLGNPMDRGAWRAVVHGVIKSQTRLNDWAAAFFLKPLSYLNNSEYLLDMSWSVTGIFVILWISTMLSKGLQNFLKMTHSHLIYTGLFQGLISQRKFLGTVPILWLPRQVVITGIAWWLLFELELIWYGIICPEREWNALQW